MSAWRSLAEWWDAGPAPQAKDREAPAVREERPIGLAAMNRQGDKSISQTYDGTDQMAKWRTPGFDGRATVARDKQAIERVTVTLSDGDEHKLANQQREVGRERGMDR